MSIVIFGCREKKRLDQPKTFAKPSLIIILLGKFLCINLVAQVPPEPRQPWEMPRVCVSSHDVGKVVLGVSNKGYFGNSTVLPYYDCASGLSHYSGSEFPKQSLLNHLRFGSIWIGGILSGDTLVSEGHFGHYFELHDHPPLSEFNPDEFPLGDIKHGSDIRGTENYDLKAKAEQQLTTIYTDTIVAAEDITDNHPGYYDFLDFRLHKPLYVEITQNSYSWSLEYAEDLVLIEINIKNIGEKTIRDFSAAIHTSSATGYKNELRPPGPDELGGFLRFYPLIGGCQYDDTLNIMWMADNDGDPYNGTFTNQIVLDTIGLQYKSVTSASGISFVSIPDNPNIFYNWWSLPPFDFGPIAKGNYRNFHTGGIGAPDGDRNKFFLMRNGETDYDVAFTKSINQFNQNWIYPDQIWASQFTAGAPAFNSLLSFQGEFLTPGSSFPIVFAVIMGENFHTDPNNNAQNLPDDPVAFYANLNFSDLARNAQIAKWIYDNPGVDTDKDGYAGEFRICVLDSVLDSNSTWIPSVAETTYYKGDGVPDWRVALPPPSPKVWLTPTFKGIHIRFNGSESETSRDIFTRLNDFEGYRIYISRDERKTSYSLLASYDIENYDKYIWNEEKQPDPGWEILDFPSTLREIRCAYAQNCDDSAFDPLYFRSSQPFVHSQYPESLFYWVKHDWNVSEFGATTEIRKRYPNSRDPRTVPADSLTPDDYTDDGYLKFFEYEYAIDNILPTVPYYVSVTAFDFGWPKSRLEPLETSITDNAQQVYASVVDSTFNGNYKNVVVYPNPYRSDEQYRARGFEGLGDDMRSNERVRRIHFANLPPKCKIRIFSLDGDLVREIHHDKDPSDPTAAHEEWGLISRNGLAVVSGLYYWTVESEDGTVQMGKLAIIL
jgi:hypothetical protein